MSLLSLNNVSKSFGERVLFENVSFNIENNTKMGFIGTNGVGKTTLFRTILGEEDYEGEIVKSSDLKIGVMEQTPPSSQSLTAYDYALEVFSRFFLHHPLWLRHLKQALHQFRRLFRRQYLCKHGLR